jgi:hypothetical protein
MRVSQLGQQSQSAATSRAVWPLDLFSRFP